MSKIEIFQDFLAKQNDQQSIANFVIHMVVAVILSSLLGWVYVRYGRSLSNRKQFASTFVLLTMTTMLIISVVKSSLALSLGLVGALSIVRFRAAIKEPEELSYLFLTIAIGLGLGAGQLLTVLAACPIFMGVIVGRSLWQQKAEGQNLFLTITSQRDQANLDRMMATLNANCEGVDLRRFDENEHSAEATFQVDFENATGLQQSLKELREQDESMRIVFVDSKRMAA